MHMLKKGRLELGVKAALIMVALLASSPRPVRGQPVLASRASAADDSIRDFAAVVARLSEPGGYFDTDNLISNESSYLHVIGALARYGVQGGAYIGVGPDQNFSYIAAIRPRIAFIIDIRRDNMLQHLMFKALFANARNRVEYLALWLGKPAPANVGSWSEKSIDVIVAYMDSTPSTAASANAARAVVLADVKHMGLTLTAADLATVERFHSAFINAGLSLRFTSTGRAPQSYYPTLRQLILERDLEGKQSCYLGHESNYQFVKSLERRNLVIPIVGDLGGNKALPAIGAYMAQRGDKLSAFYASNAEDYVMRDGNFFVYAASIAAIPHNSNSVFIRSLFGGQHPETVPGYYSTQLLQRVDVFLNDVKTRGYSNFRDLTRRNFLPIKPR
jgi:hypothetical protein